MSFVLISHHPDDVMLPRNIVPMLANLIPISLAEAINSLPRDSKSLEEKFLEEEVRVDTKPFSPYAKNQPRVCVHISIKDKPERGGKWLEEVRDRVTTDIGYLIRSMDLPTGVQFVNDIDVTVDLVTRRFTNAGDLLGPLP